MQKINLALVYGGRSVEHDVSVISAQNISSNVDKSKYEVAPIGIDRKGRWYLMDEVSRNYDRGEKLLANLDADNPLLITEQDGREIKIDVAFIILHGTDGEDGTIQGFWQMMNIPVVGTGVLGSSISMNKIVAKKLMLQEGIPTARSIFLLNQNTVPPYGDVIEKLGTPFILKPANLGSSVGVVKVKDEKEYNDAVEKGFGYDNSILLEEFIDGREIECAVLGNINPQVSPPGEIALSEEYEIYSFDAKYVDENGAQLHIPAKVDEAVVEKIKVNCAHVFTVLECKDLARVDMFLTDENEIYISEVNTLPGFTNISMYPKLCELMGYSYPHLITTLIELAVDRKKAEGKIERDYISGLT